MVDFAAQECTIKQKIKRGANRFHEAKLNKTHTKLSLLSAAVIALAATAISQPASADCTLSNTTYSCDDSETAFTYSVSIDDESNTRTYATTFTTSDGDNVIDISIGVDATGESSVDVAAAAAVKIDIDSGPVQLSGGDGGAVTGDVSLSLQGDISLDFEGSDSPVAVLAQGGDGGTGGTIISTSFGHPGGNGGSGGQSGNALLTVDTGTDISVTTTQEGSHAIHVASIGGDGGNAGSVDGPTTDGSLSCNTQSAGGSAGLKWLF